MNDDKKSDIALDLDALAPADIVINYNGKRISVAPPTLEQFSKTIDLADSMNKISDKEKDYKQVVDLYEQIRLFIYECIPDLKDMPLNIAQITAIFELLGTLGQPTDKTAEALKAKGINVKADGEKAPKVSTS